MDTWNFLTDTWEGLDLRPGNAIVGGLVQTMPTPCTKIQDVVAVRVNYETLGVRVRHQRKTLLKNQ